MKVFSAAPAAPSIVLSRINAKSIITAIIVIVLAVLLFFSADIFNIKPADQKLPTKDLAVLDPQAEIHVGKPAEKSISSWFSSLFDSRFRKAVEKKEESAVVIRADGGAETITVPPLWAEEVSWAALRSEPSRTALTAAINQSARIASALPPTYSGSIYALYQYIGGIRYVMSEGNKTMGAEEAMRFLESLDTSVTAAMRRERVPGPDFNDWTMVSLGPVFKASRVLREKAAAKGKFAPMLKVVSVDVMQPASGDRQWMENGKAYLRVMAVLRGLESSSVLIFRNGKFIRSAKPQKMPNSWGNRFISAGNLPARGIYTFRVLSKGGDFYERTYNFYSKVRTFRWTPNNMGRFAIPYEDFDPRIDNLFFVAERGSGKETSEHYFVNNTGHDYSRF